MSYTEFFVTVGVVSIAAFFGIRMWFLARDTKRRILEADERVRARNAQFQALEAERNASAFYGKGSQLSGLGQNRGAGRYGSDSPKPDSMAGFAAAQTPSPWNMSDASQSYNPPSHHSTSPISKYHGNGGTFDGGGASSDWGSSSSSSSSDSCSSSSSSSDSGSSCSSSD